MERTGKNRTERIENLIDTNTKKLVLLFRVINAGRFVLVPDYGEMKESVVLAAILHGIRRREIVFNWLKLRGKEKKSPTVEFVNGDEGYKVSVTLEQRLLEQVEGDVETIGGPFMVDYKTDNIFGSLQRVNRENKWRIRGWEEISLALKAVYTFYRHI